MKSIPLTRGLFAVIDDGDFEELNKFRWQASWTGRMWIVKRCAGRNPCLRGRYIYITMAAQLIGSKAGLIRDHRDRNPFNHTRCNLRFATPGQSAANERRTNSTGYRGVKKEGYKYTARIEQNGKEVRLGVFTTARQAALAWNKAAVAKYGEFALVNVVKR